MSGLENVWTEEFHVRFPVSGGAVARFATLLSVLDDLPDVSWFEVRTDSAALGTPELMARLQPHSLTLYAYRTRLGDSAAALLEAVTATLKPAGFRLHGLSQHLVPIDEPYDLARSAGARAWLGAQDATDCAVLVDGYAAGLDRKYQVEFGIVDRYETRERLARTIGRMGSDQRQPPLPDDDYPAVALFADFLWQPLPSLIAPGELVPSLEDARSRLDYAVDFTTTLEQRLLHELEISKGDM